MTDPQPPAVRLVNATKRYGDFTALDHVSLEIRRGEVFALLGPNGAGKTTLISLVAGTSRPSEGSVLVLGHDVTTDFQETRRAVGLVPQEINFDPFFTVEEALRFQAGYFGVELTDERLVEILTALGLADKQKANSRQLSGGMKRRLLIAKALVHRPPVLFLDEPTAGVDVELRIELWSLLRDLNAAGTTIILTTHYLEEAESLCNNVGIVEGGKLVALEPTAKLLARRGTTSLVVSIARPLAALPPEIAARGGTYEAGAQTIEFHGVEPGAISPILLALGTADIEIANVDFRKSTLQDVFLELVGK
jgi:ABC-2 type transport system ATP-binding protein